MAALKSIGVVVAIVASASLAWAEDQVVASGTFTGASGHETSGTVTILKTDSGFLAVLEEDFSLDGAPDPKLGFGQDGYVETTTFSDLNKNTGRQSYAIPARINPDDFNEFYIWCERFAVPLGVAKLN